LEGYIIKEHCNPVRFGTKASARDFFKGKNIKKRVQFFMTPGDDKRKVGHNNEMRCNWTYFLTR
jgi:hypothetical protein